MCLGLAKHSIYFKLVHGCMMPGRNLFDRMDISENGAFWDQSHDGLRLTLSCQCSEICCQPHRKWPLRPLGSTVAGMTTAHTPDAMAEKLPRMRIAFACLVDASHFYTVCSVFSDSADHPEFPLPLSALWAVAEESHFLNLTDCFFWCFQSISILSVLKAAKLRLCRCALCRPQVGSVTEIQLAFWQDGCSLPTSSGGCWCRRSGATSLRVTVSMLCWPSPWHLSL